jgi:ATP-dependent Clp protease ATP-binding subunit ClpC
MARRRSGLRRDVSCIEVPEPSIEAALPLLRHYACSLEQRFGLAIDDAAVCEAAALMAQYIWNDQLPAKALKVLYQACEDMDFERRRQRAQSTRITVDDIVRVVEQRTGVPEETLRGIAARCDYASALSAEVLGQEHAIREVATELGLIKAGMTEPGKPASVVMLLGQTGTGKTELAKALARIYSTSKRLKVYTLGNCVEPHSVSTLIGVPPGYVGHDRGGPLVNDLLADPYGVFLLDEADKAHPDVLQPFLNLFDEGWVEDQRGVRAYADKAIFVLTTNVGQRMIAELAEQGKTPEEIATRMKEALSQIRHTKSERPVFTPEFLARIKRIIVFNPLQQETIEGIARKQVRELCRNWTARRGKELEIPEDLVRHIADEAHRINAASKGKEGGRVVRKLVADRIEAHLQRTIAERPDEYRQCQRVRVGFDAIGTDKESDNVVVQFANGTSGAAIAA